MADQETYKAKVHCSNCELQEEIDIPKGQIIDETECPNCGTLKLNKDYGSVVLGGSHDNYY